jgi:hypothetical protein
MRALYVAIVLRAECFFVRTFLHLLIPAFILCAITSKRGHKEKNKKARLEHEGKMKLFELRT